MLVHKLFSSTDYEVTLQQGSKECDKNNPNFIACSVNEGISASLDKGISKLLKSYRRPSYLAIEILLLLSTSIALVALSIAIAFSLLLDLGILVTLLMMQLR